jgi:hypothetical protein
MCWRDLLTNIFKVWVLIHMHYRRNGFFDGVGLGVFKCKPIFSKGISGILRSSWTTKQYVTEKLISFHVSKTVEVGKAVRKRLTKISCLYCEQWRF